MSNQTFIFWLFSFLLINRNTWKSMRINMLHWAHWNPTLNTVCKSVSSARTLTTAAITQLRSVCTQQVKKKRNIYSWTWWCHVTNLMCDCNSACLFFLFYILCILCFFVVAWRLDISLLSLLGRPLVWLKVVLPVLCGILLIIILTFLYKFHEFRRKPSEYMTPESLLVRISSLWGPLTNHKKALILSSQFLSIIF